MRYVGIDYSMSCPAMVTWTDREGKPFAWEDCTAYFVTDVRKYVGRFDHNVFGIAMKDWSCQEERFNHLADTFGQLLERDDRVVLEGYAMGAKGMVFHIGENTGLLKNRMWTTGVHYESVSPSVIKKHATGKGNSDKKAMHEAFVNLTGFDLKRKLGMSEQNWSPSGDVVDAFFACSLATTLPPPAIDTVQK